MRKLIESHKQLLVKLMLVLAALIITKVGYEIKYKRAILSQEYTGTYLK